MNRRTAILLLSLLAAAPSPGAELADGKLSLNFTGGWVYGVTDHNRYDTGALVADTSGQFTNAEFNLTLAARPVAGITFAGQIFFDDAPDGQTAGLDWAFAEYAVSDSLKLRAGKVKMPFGLFGEVEAIGTLRPFYSLATSVYGPSALLGVAYYGAGITGAKSAGEWTISYDLYGGQTQVEATEPWALLTGPLHPGNQTGAMTEDVRHLIGGRLGVSTPIDGLQFRLSAYHGDLDDSGLTSAMLSAEYTDEQWGARAEAFIGSERTSQYGGYAEVSRFLTSQLQVAGRAELVQVTTNLGIPTDSQLLRHRELALGVNWWFHTGLVLKVAYHDVVGNRFAFPTLLDDALAGNGVPVRTRMVTAGTQFTF